MKAPRGQLEQRLLVLVTLALVAFGLVMVFSATSAAAALGKGDPITFLKRQGVYALIGIALLVVASRFDHRRLRNIAPPLLLTSLGLCVAVLVVAPEINGAKRWLTAGPFTFQPSELAKLGLLLWAAAYLSRSGAPRTLGELWKPVGMVTCLFAALIVVEPDLGTTISLLLMIGGMLVVAGVPGRTLGAAATIATLGGLAAIWMEPYRRARLFSFLDPWADPEDTGFQTVQALIGIGSGGVTGKGLGEGVQKINYLPEQQTDMILAVIGEELGLIGTDGRDRRVRRLRVRGLHRRAALPRPVREAPGRRDHVARLRPGGRQSRGRARGRPADRDPAPVRLVRRLEPRRTARGRRHPP